IVTVAAPSTNQISIVLRLGLLPQHAVLQLAAPVEFVYKLPRVAPTGLSLDIQFEEHPGSQHAFDLDAGRGSNLLQHLTTFADQNPLLPIALAIDSRSNPRQPLSFLKTVDDDGGRVGNLLARVQQHLLADRLRRHEASRLIRDLVFRKI